MVAVSFPVPCVFFWSLQALSEYTIVGLPTNIAFCKAVLDHKAFIEGNIDTGFIPRYIDELLAHATPTPAALQHALTLATAFTLLSDTEYADVDDVALRVNHEMSRTFEYTARDGAVYGVSAVAERGDAHQWRLVTAQRPAAAAGAPATKKSAHAKAAAADSGARVQCAVRLVDVTRLEPDGGQAAADAEAAQVRVDLDGHVLSGVVVRHVGADGVLLTVRTPSGATVALRPTPLQLSGAAGARATAAADLLILSPMPGKVLAVPAVGDSVEAGAALVRIEAMKMEHTIRAAIAGTVEAVHFAVNDLVGDRALIVKLKRKE